MPLIQIIVPVYNTEKYLRRCLDSLVNQTFKDIEIIIVNDCSQGNCKEIIEEYKKEDNRIKYIEHSENKSLLQARKTGNINSRGKYIMYVDSDDELDINTCKEIFNVIKNKLKNSQNVKNAVCFSIIIPVYNTEIYLRRCLDSLVNQTFNDIEIIIVNDASQGNCK